MTQQMSLAVTLRDDCRFDNFFTRPHSPSAQVVEFLQNHFANDRERHVYLWGPAGAGLSHLLQATCHHWVIQRRSVQYLPLAELQGFVPEQVMNGMEHIDLVCVDGLDQLGERPNWQEALFHFYNRSKDRDTCLLFAGSVPPARLPLQLADLRSRLSGATVFQLPLYGDAEKIQILQFRATCLGLQLSEEAATYLLYRVPRQLSVLIEKLGELDRKSLIHQRRLSIPFIKQVFGW